jgi:penicillin-binding protein 1A
MDRKNQASFKRRAWQAGFLALAAAVCIAVLVGAYAFVILQPNLPSIDALTSYKPKMPLRVFTADNVLIGEFGEERREFIPIAQIPKIMKEAVLDIEDENFYKHGGVDFWGLLRASLANLRNSRSQGASTITMQVTRNFLLNRQKTYTRKLQEIMLSYKIEEALTKDQILELYMNQIYLGERAYGFGTAARVYFNKPLKDITIAEAAMLAGLPKAPAANNPMVNPKRAIERQQYILKRMHDLGHITDAQYEQALKEKLNVQSSASLVRTHAEYAAEIVRQFMYNQYKDDIYTSGMSVYTTLTKADQDAAYAAVRRGVMDYDRRHGYRGPEDAIALPKDEDDRDQAIDEALQAHPDSGELKAAVVLSASPKLVRAQMASGDVIELKGDGLRFAASWLSGKAKDKILPGAVIRVTQDAKSQWTITQIPDVSAAFVSVNARDGGIRAFVGGFDFGLGKFDHVTQAWRQPGSTIKPLIYSSALEKGFSPATLINDAQLTDGDNGSWNPGNDDGQYDGPITMRTGLKKSKNLVSIRILRAVTPAYAQKYLERFGLDADKQPLNLTMTLGTGSVTPYQMVGAYAVFANGGYHVMPYLIAKVVDAQGKVLSDVKPVQAGDESIRVIDARNAFIMDSMLKDVVRSGTGYMASQRLGRSDIAGKTGTTNDAMDGWFAGYGGDTVGVAWIGYDQPRSLGTREFGATLALPVWIDYMREALRGKPETQRPVPAGVVQVDGDWMYQEYVDSNSYVRSLDVNDVPSFLQRIFGGGPSTPAPADSNKRDDMYR